MRGQIEKRGDGAYRARRNGQIKKRGERKWLVSVFVGREPSGRRTYRAETVHGTKKDADRKLAELLRRRGMTYVSDPAAIAAPGATSQAPGGAAPRARDEV